MVGTLRFAHPAISARQPRRMGEAQRYPSYGTQVNREDIVQAKSQRDTGAFVARMQRSEMRGHL